eukprot:2186852-Prymnesium_polylepis.2
MGGTNHQEEEEEPSTHLWPHWMGGYTPSLTNHNPPAKQGSCWGGANLLVGGRRVATRSPMQHGYRTFVIL